MNPAPQKKLKILVLAGGADQCALIQELQRRGHEVLLLDFLPNPPAKQLVSKHIQESTLDVEAVKDCVIKEGIDLICTGCTDQALLTVAKVSEDLSLPCYISYEQARSVTNKTYMKDMMIKGHVPTSRYHTVESLDDINKCNDFPFPLVVKPADCNSSKGVTKVTSLSELRTAIENALALSRTSKAIVEEFKVGKEISADFYIQGDSPIFLSASESFKIPNRKGFTILGSYYEPLPQQDVNDLLEIAGRITKAFNLCDTPLLVQLIQTDEGYSVIEFSARMGGGSKYRLIQEISGVDIMAEYVNLILGEHPHISPVTNSCFIKMVYVYSYPGIIKAVEGTDKLKSDSVIKDYFVYKTPGNEVAKCETSSDRVLGYLVTAESRESLNAKVMKANDGITVLDTDGHDIMMHNLISE